MSWDLLYALDFFALSLFAISYYRNCYRQGYRIDFWHVQLFSTCVLPILVMLPFAKNEMNRLVVGQDFAATVEALPFVFLASLLGFFSMLLGGSFWGLRAGLGIRRAAGRVLDIVPQCSMMLMSSRSVLVFQALLCFFLQIVILSIYFSQSGFGFDLRQFTFANPSLRPVALLISGYSVTIASHCLARYIDKKEKVLLGCTLLLSLGLFFFGARSNIATIYISILVCYLIKLRTRVSLLKLSTLIFAILIVGLYLGSARAGNYSLGDFFGTLMVAIFFGNTFSDLREFAWVYADWNHEFWIGKTYLAALISFVPRFLSDFRDTSGLGVMTSTTLGFDPHVHPGVRPGAFGEGYFNFGLLGVLVVGLLLGIISRYIDIYTKKNLAPQQFSMMRAFAFTNLTILSGTISVTSGASNLYVLAGIFLFTWLCLQVQRIFVMQN
jgi:oligosaccharide repeat unit polymerase